MNTVVATQDEGANPFTRQSLQTGVNVGAVAVEQERAIAEAQGQLILAKRFPRDLNSAHAELMIACKSKAFAEVAFYSVPNRGTGPSIRFAEEVARCVGNFEYGHRELSRDGNKSEVEVYAWDKEKNNYSRRQLTVLHILDTKNGPKALRDQADIDNKIANVASKQMRGRILALLPKWLVAEAIEECKKTIAGTNDEPISTRVRKMTQAFARFGVTTEHLERYIGCKLDDVMLDQLVDMTGVFNALREGAKPSDYFASAAERAELDKPESVTKLAALAAQASGEAPANDNAKQVQQEQVDASGAAPASTRRQSRRQQAEPKPAEQQPQDQAPEVETQAEQPAADPVPAEEPAAEQQQTQAAPAGKDLF